MSAGTTREVADGVVACEQPDGPRTIRQAVIVGATHALVVDTGLPGAPAAGILPVLAQRGVTPIILLTHPDGDHVAGTAEILAAHPGARVLGGAGDLDLLGRPARILDERYGAFSTTDDVPFTPEQRARAATRVGAPFATPEAVHGGERIDLGGREVELLATPGHSPGHTAAWLPDAGVLVCADAAMGRAITDRTGAGYVPPMYTPPATYRATVRALAALPVRCLVTGHEPVMDGAAAAAFLAASLAACDRLAALVEAAVGDGPSTLLGVCARVHAAYGDLPADRVRDLALTVDGHLADLVAAGRATVAAGPPRRWSPA